MPGQQQAAKTFLDLLVWQRVHSFFLGVYKMTAAFPTREVDGLTSQMRRAAVSIPANIAEGFVKRGKADKARMSRKVPLRRAATTWSCQRISVTEIQPN
jgi:23S rRNA-intervening sequence protein